jgi:glycosyltransferase involved in cell wall biosynthesis
MKLVIATPLYPPEIGGPATYAKLLFEGLPAKGIEVDLVKFSEVRHLPKLIRHFVYYRRVLRAARGADVVLALDPVSVGLPAMWAAKKANKPFVVKIVGDYAWEQGQQRFGITQNLDEFVKMRRVPFLVRVLQRIQTRVARSVTRIIVPSEYLKNIVSTWGIQSEKIEVIYNGIDLPKSMVVSSRPQGFFVVSSGRRVPWKGFEAIERVVARETGWHFTLLQGLSRSEALSRTRVADAFVINSSYEGLSHALIEAMMLNVPIVATSVGGNIELIEDGKTGLLVPFGDEEALHKALKQIANDPFAAKARAAAALERARALFSMESMLMRTNALLKSL